MDIGLGLAASGAVAFAIWLPFARRRLSRSQQVPAGPPTMELRHEAPGIVNALVNELHPTPDAVAATILDLAVRRHLEVVQLSPEEHLVLLPRAERTDPLAPFEARILHAIAAAGGERREATVPAIAEALRPGTADTWLRFKTDVLLEAKAAGLVAPPTTGSVTPLMLVCLLPCLGLLVAAPMAYILAPFLYVALFLAAVICLVVGHSYQLTEAGRTAASHWLGVRSFIEDTSDFDGLPAGAVAIWDRYLAHGAAMGLTGAATRGLVHELRTTVTFADVGSMAVAFGQAVRDQQGSG